MTIASETSSAGPYAGDDTTDNFSFAFKVFTSADIAVVLTDSTDVDTTLTITTHYTVSLNADQEASPGGSVTLLTPPATGENLTILRDMTLTQGAALPNQGGWYPEVVENALDKLTMITQQLEEKIDRAIVVGVTGNPDTYLEDTQAAATAAAASQAAAAASAAAALISEGAASASEIAAAASAGTAAASEAVVVALQPDIQTCATNIAAIIAAPTEASNAAASASAAAASYDSFDDRYLGAKAADPTLDNDGNALLTGALYWNTGSNEMRAYSGSAWVAAYVPGTTYVTGAASSVDSEIALFSGTGGKTIKRASTTGLLKAESGVIGAVVSGTDIKTINSTSLLGSGDISIPAAFKNKIIGGDFTTNPWQRGTTFTSATTPANSDDTYLADRWYILSDGNDIVDVTRSTDAPTGAIYSLAMDVETANKKFGIAQIVEYANAAPLIGGTCTLSFKAKTSGSSLTNLKAAVIAWSGTADTVTSDVISAWGADGVTPTLIANATFENTPANLSVTGSWATYTISGISIDTASTKNLIVFIWCDNATTTITDFLYVTQVQLESGSTATSFETRPYGVELALCQRYYFRQAETTNGVFHAIGGNGSATTAVLYTRFNVSMRAAPTTIEQTGTPANYQVSPVEAGAIVASGGPTFSSATKEQGVFVVSVASGLTAGNFSTLLSNAAGAYIGWSAEL